MFAVTFSCSIFSLIALLSLATAQSCTLQFDARVTAGTSLSSFDTTSNLFSSSNVFGAGLAFSDLLQLPDVAPSLFDVNTIPIEVTISDDSIFNNQTGFRRAELVPVSNTGTDDSTLGVKTVHFSLIKDSERPLNTSHEYQLFFLESNDFTTNQVVLKTGTILGTNTIDPDTLQLFGNVNEAAPGPLFSTPFTEDVFHNFALTLNFDDSTTSVFYSTGTDALEQVVKATANNVSGQGQFHFGVLKKGVNGGADITKDAEQPAGINEGLIFGGIFEEDTADGCVSLSP